MISLCSWLQGTAYQTEAHQKMQENDPDIQVTGSNCRHLWQGYFEYQQVEFQAVPSVYILPE